MAIPRYMHYSALRGKKRKRRLRSTAGMRKLATVF